MALSKPVPRWDPGCGLTKAEWRAACASNDERCRLDDLRLHLGQTIQQGHLCLSYDGTPKLSASIPVTAGKRKVRAFVRRFYKRALNRWAPWP
jgi:hypothetical protein